MAKLKHTPTALIIIKAASYISCTIFVLSLLFAIIAIAGTEFKEYLYSSLYSAILGLIFYALMGGVYYITKAACLYIEKEESE